MFNSNPDSVEKTEKSSAINIQNTGKGNISVGGDVINAGSVVHIHGNVTINDEQVLASIPHSELWITFEQEREKLKQRIVKYPDDPDFKQELNELEKRMDAYKQYVIQLARKLQQTEVNTERFKRAREHFEKGEFELANKVLDKQELSNEQAALLKEKEESEKKLQDSEKKLQDNAAEFIFKAKLTAIDYSLKTERIPQAEALFEKALISERSASNLFEFGLFLQENNQFSKANKVYQEALALYRGLAEQNRTVYLPDVAMTLNNLANLVSKDSSRRQEAEKYYQEALALYRGLAEQNRTVYIPYVATTLNNLANWVSKDSSRRQEAEKYYQEALEIRRGLAEQNRTVYLPDVAMTLNNLAALVSDDSSRRQEAEEYCQEAIAIYRTLVQQSPSQYSPDLARILIVTSSLKLELKEYEQAKKLLEEAERLIKPYAEQQPNIWGAFIEMIRELKTSLE